VSALTQGNETPGPAPAAPLKDNDTRLLTDSVSEIFAFLREAWQLGQRCALVTLVEIVGHTARPLGTHMAVREDGNSCGFVSGGCVEGAVTGEALAAIAAGADRLCRFGKGSPFFDIVLPCGGGLCLSIHVLRSAEGIIAILDGFAARRPRSLVYDPAGQSLSVRDGAARTGWRDGRFLIVYRPPLRVLLSGTGLEAVRFAAIASGAGVEVIHLAANRAFPDADAATAIVLMHHDIEGELPVLRRALQGNAFYIGCLGSRRTHAVRASKLMRDGFTAAQLDRIHAPIGLFGPARDARSIAVSVLAQILALSGQPSD